MTTDLHIKIDLERRLRDGAPVVIELGCGNNKPAGRIGIDRVHLPAVDIVSDLEHGLPFLPDNSVDEFHSHSFFEHVGDLELLLRELCRTLKPGGKSYSFVPHFSNPYYYSDYTHAKFFGLYTLYYFSEFADQPKRKVPNHYTDIRIKVLRQRGYLPPNSRDTAPPPS